MAKKFYAVRKGRTSGIYESWDEAKAQVDGFKGAEFKGIMTREEAESFMKVEAQLSACDLSVRSLKQEQKASQGFRSPAWLSITVSTQGIESHFNNLGPI